MPQQSHHLFLVGKLFTPQEEILAWDLSFAIFSHPDHFVFRVGGFGGEAFVVVVGLVFSVCVGVVMIFFSNIFHLLF